MNNSADDGDRDAVREDFPLRYAPKPLLVGVYWAGLVAAVGWALLTDEPPARVLAVAAVLLLTVLAVRATAVRPRLAAGPDGVLIGRVGTPLRRPWTEVHRVEVVETSRLGRTVGMLEIDVIDDDGAEKLLVFTPLDLGVDAWIAAQDIAAIRGHHRDLPG